MKAIRNYTLKRGNKLRSLIKRYKRSNDPEIAHQIRVEIKKIKAILRLIEYQHDKFDSHKAYKPYRTIFRACHTIRGPQVLDALSGKSHGSKIKANKSVAAFRKQLPDFLKKVNKSNRKLFDEIRNVKSKTLSAYLSEKKVELRKKLYPKFQAIELHKTRKLVKEIMYLESINTPKKKNQPFYADVALRIGDWHDRLMLIQHETKKATPNSASIKKWQMQNRRDLADLRSVIKIYYSRNKW